MRFLLKSIPILKKIQEDWETKQCFFRQEHQKLSGVPMKS